MGDMYVCITISRAALLPAILGVAMQEMLHLSLRQETSVGVVPHESGIQCCSLVAIFVTSYLREEVSVRRQF